nr:hypothetical protein [Tanacetum cinerariifolium]
MNVFVRIGFDSTIELVSFDQSQVVSFNGKFICGFRNSNCRTRSRSNNTVDSPHGFVVHRIIVLKGIKKVTEVVEIKDWNVDSSGLLRWFVSSFERNSPVSTTKSSIQSSFRIMNPQEIQVVARDEKWVSFTKRVKISSTNVRLETTVPHKEEIFQVQFWYTIKKVQGINYEFLLANKKFMVNADVFRMILDIYPRVEGVNFTDVLDDDTTLAFLIKLRYKGPLYKHTNIENFDYPESIWEDIAFQIDHTMEKRSRHRVLPDVHQVFHWSDSPKKSRGKVKRKTASRRVVKKKVTIYDDDNIVPDPDVALELGKSISLTKAKEEEEAKQVHDTHARIVTESVPESAKKKSSGRSSREVVDIMQALKESKKTSKRQPGTRGSSEGTGTIPRVFDKSTLVSATSSEETDAKPGVPDEEKDIDEENYKIRVQKDKDVEMLSAEVEYSGKGDVEVSDAAKTYAEKIKEAKDDSKKAELLPKTPAYLYLQTMHANKSFNRNPANHRLYLALIKALIEDENAMDKGLADTVRDHKRKQDDDDDDDDDDDPPARLNQKLIAEVEMDHVDKDVVLDDDQPQDTFKPKTAKTRNPEWFTQHPRPPSPEPEWNEQYLKSSYPERTYTTSITKNKAARYEIEGIEDMLNKFSKNNVYSTKKILAVKSVGVKKLHRYGHLEEIVMKRADHQLYKFKECDFVDLHMNDIEDMLLLAVQRKLFHLIDSDIIDFIVALRMFTRSLVIKKRVKDLELGVESYLLKLNITPPQQTFPEIEFKDLYTPSHKPPEVIYEDLVKQKRVMRADKLYKFLDGTLKKV